MEFFVYHLYVTVFMMSKERLLEVVTKTVVLSTRSSELVIVSQI